MPKPVFQSATEAHLTLQNDYNHVQCMESYRIFNCIPGRKSHDHAAVVDIFFQT